MCLYEYWASKDLVKRLALIKSGLLYPGWALEMVHVVVHGLDKFKE